MYFLEKDRDGKLVLNKKGRQLLNHFYKPPKQHGKKHMKEWQQLELNVKAGRSGQ